MTRLAVILLLALPLSAQDLFPKFSIIGGHNFADFETNARIDPELSGGEGTLVSFENDLGLEDTRDLQRYALQWNPARRHEFGAAYFHVRRGGFEEIDREITFRDQVYPVQATVTTEFDLDYLSATYTFWARRSDRDSLGISLGAAAIAIDAGITAQIPGNTLLVREDAETEVPVLLAGLQGRVAFSPRWFGEAAVSTLPNVTIEDYSGSALTGQVRLEFRPVRWIGVGAAYHYFRMDIDVEDVELTGALDMTIRGPEAFVRLAF